LATGDGAWRGVLDGDVFTSSFSTGTATTGSTLATFTSAVLDLVYSCLFTSLA